MESVSTISSVTRIWSPSFWKWPVRTSATFSSRPAVWGSTSPFAYLCVAVNGRIEREGMYESAVAISSGNANRRWSVDGSPARFWNGSTASVIEALADPPGAGAARRCDAAHQVPAASARTAAAAIHQGRLVGCVGAIGAGALPLAADSESRLSRFRSVFSSAALW